VDDTRTITCPGAGAPGSYRNIIFDLDGTLTDSGPGIMKSVVYAYDGLGLPAPGPDELRTFVGPTLQYSFARYGVPEERIEEAVATFRERYNVKGIFENEPYRGIPEVLRALTTGTAAADDTAAGTTVAAAAAADAAAADATAAAGATAADATAPAGATAAGTTAAAGTGTAPVRLFIGSSKPEPMVRKVLDHFDLTACFTGIYGSLPTPFAQEKADVLRRLMETEHLTAQDTVMVGDTEFDVRGARELGIPCVGVTWGYGDAGAMQEAGAICLVREPEELLALGAAGHRAGAE